MNNALVSVIIPVYNVSDYIERCVSSLLTQTYQNIEIILINDGSTDNSSEVCRKLKDEHPEKIVFIEQENKGVSAARNAGLDIARGEYIVFVDADDWVSRDYVEKLHLAIIESHADLATCGFIEWRSEEKQSRHIRLSPGEYSKTDFYKEMLLRQVSLWTTMYKSSIIKQNKIRFDILLRRMEDGCFVADYTSRCDKFTVITEYLYFYYQREDSVIHQYRPQTLVGVERDAYITDFLEKTYDASGIDKSIYKHQFISRWSYFMAREAIAVTNKKHPTKYREKIDFLKKSIEVSNIKDRLEKIGDEKKTFAQKLFVRWTIKEKVRLLLAYGYAYNLLKSMRR